MYYSSTSPLSVMFFQSNLIAVKLIRRKPCRLWIYYIVHWLSFFVFWFIFTTLHAYLGKAFCFCPVHPSVCSAVCPSQKFVHATPPTSLNRIPLNYVCLFITVWRIITACRLDNFRRSYCPLTKNISLKK
jgi:hypothetical protein